jgi:hypothetical protein
LVQITATNEYNQQINLTSNPAIKLTRVTGLTPAKAAVNTSALATKDGSIFNSSHVQNRNIVLTIYPAQNIEQTRVNLYQYFKTKHPIKLHIQTATRRVWIDGYIESMEGDLFDKAEKIQISIICPDPYFKSEDTTVVDFESDTETITNASDDETGVVVEITATGAAQGITITNETTGESFSSNQQLAEGDKMILNTRRGEKSLTLVSGGTTTNIINTMEQGSDWFPLIPGANTISYEAEQGAENLTARLTLQPIFEGV